MLASVAYSRVGAFSPVDSGVRSGQGAGARDRGSVSRVSRTSAYIHTRTHTAAHGHKQPTYTTIYRT